METLEDVYLSAAAVLTAPVGFMEWRTLRVDNPATPDPRLIDDWSPLGLFTKVRSGDFDCAPAQRIEGERFIYVFSRHLRSNDVPTLVEELKVDAGGIIYAAQLGARRFPDTRPLDGKDSPLPEKRQWHKIGTTMRFVRRLRGSQMAHYFFASRIQLSRAFVQELRTKVAFWAPETQFDDSAYVLPTTSGEDVPAPSTFGEWDQNLLTGMGAGALQVPVLDPITIALCLHDLATSATNDLYDYATIYDGQGEKKRERVVKRQQKIVLAYVVQMVLKNYDTGPGDSKHEVSVRTNKFIEEYWQQINYRVQEKERWWTYLGNWYQSDPVEFLFRAHFEHADERRWSFFLPMLLCLLDANSSEAGRAMLKSVVEGKEKFKWLHKTVLPELDGNSEEDTKAETYQVPRKFALAVLEVVKELGPHFLDGSTAAMWRVLGAHSKHFHVRFFVDGAPMDADPLEAAKKFEHSQKKLGIDVPEPEEIVEEWHELAEHGYVGKVLKITTVVEVIDLTLSIRQFLNERSLDHGLNMIRSAADTSALLLEFAHGAKGKLLGTLFRLRPGIIVVAALIEGYLSVKGAVESAAKDDQVGVASGAITATGAGVTILGVVGMVGLDLTPTPFFVVGLILMGVGAIIGLFKDTPMDTFLKHCAFDRDGGGGEIVEGLEEMKAGEYGQQLEVLLNLLCRFKFERADVVSIGDGDKRVFDGRTARVTMGWIPDGAKLVVDYHDKWRLGPQQFRQTGVENYEEAGQTDKMTRAVDFGKGGVSLNADRQFDITLSKARFFDASSSDYDFEAHFATQLHLSFGDFEFVVPPKPQDFEINIGWPASSE